MVRTAFRAVFGEESESCCVYYFSAIIFLPQFFASQTDQVAEICEAKDSSPCKGWSSKEPVAVDDLRLDGDHQLDSCDGNRVLVQDKIRRNPSQLVQLLAVSAIIKLPDPTANPSVDGPILC